jgi:hypothetical protein
VFEKIFKPCGNFFNLYMHEEYKEIILNNVCNTLNGITGEGAYVQKDGMVVGYR